MIIKILSYFRKDTSTLPAFSAIVLLLSSPLLLVNLLVQPVQAQTTLSFRTPTPAEGYDRPTGQEVALTFDAHGTTSTSDPLRADITNGTIQLQARYTYNGKIISGVIDNRTGVGFISFDATINNTDYSVESFCSTSQSNDITVKTGGGQTETDFSGPVECSSSQVGGEDTTAQQPSPSSSMTGTTTSQSRDSNSTDGDGDSDSDGIPDSSDNCPNHSHHRCYKVGDTNTTSTDQQQPSSSSSMTGTAQDSDSNDGDSSSGSSTDSNSDSDSKDSDSDGIPDSSDNCPNHSHHRCFKEGDTTTTTNQPQQSSSSNGNGNQTRQ